jgi:hypothetical protein
MKDFIKKHKLHILSVTDILIGSATVYVGFGLLLTLKLKSLKKEEA